jgi:dolichyl-diphosphooligosaccharide--protein glycosyltransferase
MSGIRRLFNKEKIADSLRAFGKLRIKLSHATLLEFSILFLILVLAFTIRLLPMHWGYYLSEFDPYFEYRVTKDMVQNGPLHWLSWQDQMSWWPWGTNIGANTFPGVEYTGYVFYEVLNALGVPLVSSSGIDPLASDPVYNVCVMIPVIMGVLAVLIIYFFGKDIGGKTVGLFSAFFLALSASFIGRTSIGFYDHDSVGIFALLFLSLLFLRSIEKERSTRGTWLYGIASGLLMGYIILAWGASRYAIGLIVLFSVVLLLLGRYSSRLLISYGTTFALAFAIALLFVPHLGGYHFLLEATNVVTIGVFLIMCGIEIRRYIATPRMKNVFALCFIIALAAGFAALNLRGSVTALPGKYSALLNPFEGLVNPVAASVQEHIPAAWGSMYYDLGIGILFIPVGFYFAAENPTNRNVYLILFGLTAIYFAGAMSRLMLILAPALCLLWALALDRVLRPFITLLREAPTTFRRKTRFEAHVGKEFSAALLIIIFLLLTLTFVFPSIESQASGGYFPRVLVQADIPTTIAAASLPVKPDLTVPDWLDALTWMRYNLPSDAVVAEWWDYGYWITVVANKTTLSDNNAFNSTQMGRIGLMFLSNETDALKIIDQFNQEGRSQWQKGLLQKPSNVTYVVAFFTFDSKGNDVGYGEEGKWKWMANIAFGNLNAWESYGNYTLGEDATGQGTSSVTPITDSPAALKGQSTILYKMMMYAKSKRVSSITATPPDHFELIYWSQKGVSTPVTAGGINALVTVWQVKP